MLPQTEIVLCIANQTTIEYAKFGSNILTHGYTVCSDEPYYTHKLFENIYCVFDMGIRRVTVSKP